MEKKQMTINRKRIFDIIQIGQKGDLPSRIFDIFITAVIIVNIITLFLGTFDSMSDYSGIMDVLEKITLYVFLIEYILRILTADYLFPDLPRKNAVIRFLLSPDGIVDLLTIIPLFFLSGFVVLRMMRVVRILHLFRINAQYDSFHAIASVFISKRNQILSSLFIIVILMLASSLCMYNVEHSAQPDVFDNAFSGIWWSLSTIFTVGYGDIYPVTVMGKIFAVMITFLGVCAVAIPTGIISAGFVEQYTLMQKNNPMNEESKILITVTVEEKSVYAGWTVKKTEQEYNINVATIIRSGEVLLPLADTKIMPDDTLIYQANSL